MGAALWSWFLVGSEGNVRHWSLLARRRFRPSVPWWFAVSESAVKASQTSLWSCFGGMGAALWSMVSCRFQKATLSILELAIAKRRFSVLQYHGVLLLSESPARFFRCGAVDI